MVGEYMPPFTIEVAPYISRPEIAVYNGRSFGCNAICTFPLVRAIEVRFIVE